MSGVAGRDDGAGSVQVLALVAVVLVLCTAVGSLGAAHRASAAARAAADLAALAAAASVAVPPGVVDAAPRDACALAAEVASRNDARLVRCERDGDVVAVTASRRSVLGTATADARAGPRSARGAS